MFLSILKNGSNGERCLYDTFQTMMLTGITCLYTVYVGRYGNPTQSIPYSDEVHSILKVLWNDLKDYGEINGQPLMKELLIPTFLK